MTLSKSESQLESLKHKLDNILKYIASDGSFKPGTGSKKPPSTQELEKIINEELGLENSSTYSTAILSQKIDYAFKLLHIYETGKSYKDIKTLYDEEKEKQSDADKNARKLDLIGTGFAVVALTLFVLAIVSGFLPVSFAFAENSLLGPIIFGFSSGIATYTSGAVFSHSANTKASAKGSKIDRIYDKYKNEKIVAGRVMNIDKSKDEQASKHRGEYLEGDSSLEENLSDSLRRPLEESDEYNLLSRRPLRPVDSSSHLPPVLPPAPSGLSSSLSRKLPSLDDDESRLGGTGLLPTLSSLRQPPQASSGLRLPSSLGQPAFPPSLRTEHFERPAASLRSGEERRLPSAPPRLPLPYFPSSLDPFNPSEPPSLTEGTAGRPAASLQSGEGRRRPPAPSLKRAEDPSVFPSLEFLLSLDRPGPPSSEGPAASSHSRKPGPTSARRGDQVEVSTLASSQGSRGREILPCC